MEKTLILGLGNPFRGDDGVGLAVIAALDSQELSPDVVVLDGGTPGLESVLIWQGYQRVIIVDAADMGMRPGSWKRFLPGEAILPVGNGAIQGTLHAAGLAEALALAEALGNLPPELIFYGVQPENTGWSADLTEVVSAAVPVLCAAITAEIKDYAARNNGQLLC